MKTTSIKAEDSPPNGTHGPPAGDTSRTAQGAADEAVLLRLQSSLANYEKELGSWLTDEERLHSSKEVLRIVRSSIEEIRAKIAVEKERLHSLEQERREKERAENEKRVAELRKEKAQLREENKPKEEQGENGGDGGVKSTEGGDTVSEDTKEEEGKGARGIAGDGGDKINKEDSVKEGESGGTESSKGGRPKKVVLTKAKYESILSGRTKSDKFEKKVLPPPSGEEILVDTKDKKPTVHDDNAEQLLAELLLYSMFDSKPDKPFISFEKFKSIPNKYLYINFDGAYKKPFQGERNQKICDLRQQMQNEFGTGKFSWKLSATIQYAIKLQDGEHGLHDFAVDQVLGAMFHAATSVRSNHASVPAALASYSKEIKSAFELVDTTPAVLQGWNKIHDLILKDESVDITADIAETLRNYNERLKLEILVLEEEAHRSKGFQLVLDVIEADKRL